jgi:Fe2+ or Zn2+ uptake regulation protein
MKKTKEILDQFGLKKTEIRLKILAFLQNSNKAISQPDLEKNLSNLLIGLHSIEF